jgi:micrococcal nuclease
MYKPARRRLRKWSLPSGIIAALIVSLFGGSLVSLGDNDPQIVKRVVDGDTIVMRNDERIRLIGLDTPETVHPNKSVERFGKEASDFTRRMVQGHRVKLEFDPSNAARGYKDNTPQRRTLAYVFLEDGRLNAEIIKEGYGFALTRYPFARMEEFRRLEREARDQERGLWRRP